MNVLAQRGGGAALYLLVGYNGLTNTYSIVVNDILSHDIDLIFRVTSGYLWFVFMDEHNSFIQYISLDIYGLKYIKRSWML